MHFYVDWMSTLGKARLQSRRVEKLPSTDQAEVQEFEVGDFIRRGGGGVRRYGLPAGTAAPGPLSARLQSEIDQWSAIVKKTGVYAD
jgi:hypothetical protein